MSHWRLPDGRDYWRIIKTGVGSETHRGPIGIDKSGALILYRHAVYDKLEVVKAYGPGMWVRVEAEVENP